MVEMRQTLALEIRWISNIEMILGLNTIVRYFPPADMWHFIGSSCASSSYHRLNLIGNTRQIWFVMFPKLSHGRPSKAMITITHLDIASRNLLLLAASGNLLFEYLFSIERLEFCDQVFSRYTHILYVVRMVSEY